MRAWQDGIKYMLSDHESTGLPGRTAAQSGVPAPLRRKIWAERVQIEPDELFICRRDLPWCLHQVRTSPFRFMKNYSPNSELHWGENELRLFMWILANYLQIKKIYIDQLVQTLKLRVETIGSISTQSSPTNRVSSSNTKPSASTKNPLPPRSGPQKKIKYLPLWSGILALI